MLLKSAAKALLLIDRRIDVTLCWMVGTSSKMFAFQGFLEAGKPKEIRSSQIREKFWVFENSSFCSAHLHQHRLNLHRGFSNLLHSLIFMRCSDEPWHEYSYSICSNGYQSQICFRSVCFSLSVFSQLFSPCACAFSAHFAF